MRILNVTQSYAPFFEFGGPPEKVRALSEGLAQMGHDVTVLTADWGLERRLAELPGEPPAENGPFGRKREVRGVKTIYLANWFHYHAASWNPALPRYLRARLQNFDVVHIFGLYDLLGPRTAAAAQKLNIPYVVEPIGMFVPIVRNLFLKRAYVAECRSHYRHRRAGKIRIDRRRDSSGKNCPASKRRGPALFPSRTRRISRITEHSPGRPPDSLPRPVVAKKKP
jgi:Glycosyl transferase 4-like domain